MDISLISSDESFVKRHLSNSKQCKPQHDQNLNDSDVFAEDNFAEFNSLLTENEETDNRIVEKKRVSFSDNVKVCKNDAFKV